MSADLFDTPAPVIERDGYGRPLVIPPGGGKKIPYTRCTTFVDCLEDKYNLQRWQQRMVAIGLATRADLLLAVSAHRDDKKRLGEICEQALEAASASAAATTGTALHALTELVDRGEELPPLPDTAAADLDAYRTATAGLKVVAIEKFAVLDELKVGGTYDRIVEVDGKYYIADVKTGNIEYGIGKIAMQLAIYSRAVPYDGKTRTPHPFPLDQDRAIVIHLPAGQAECTLHWVDIAAGWDGVQLAAQVRNWRRRRNLSTPYEQVVRDRMADARAAVAAAATVDELRTVWAAWALAGVDEDQLTALCLARKAELEAAA